MTKDKRIESVFVRQVSNVFFISPHSVGLFPPPLFNPFSSKVTKNLISSSDSKRIEFLQVELNGFSIIRIEQVNQGFLSSMLLCIFLLIYCCLGFVSRLCISFFPSTPNEFFVGFGSVFIFFDLAALCLDFSNYLRFRKFMIKVL